jgi:hypothetical protein
MLIDPEVQPVAFHTLEYGRAGQGRPGGRVAALGHDGSTDTDRCDAVFSGRCDWVEIGHDKPQM